MKIILNAWLKNIKIFISGGGDLDSNSSMLASLMCGHHGITSFIEDFTKCIHDKRRWKYSYLQKLGDKLLQKKKEANK